MTTLYYLADYCDESCPCECTLDGWAAWLSKPDKEWGRKSAAQVGDQFKASPLALDEDIIATMADGKWSFSRTSDANFFAVRYGPGLGWDTDSISDTMGELIDWLAANEDLCDDIEYVAVGRHRPDIVLTYHIGGKGIPFLAIEAVQ